MEEHNIFLSFNFISILQTGKRELTYSILLQKYFEEPSPDGKN